MDSLKQYVDFSLITLVIFVVVFGGIFAVTYYSLGGMSEDREQETENTWKTPLISSAAGLACALFCIVVYKYVKDSGSLGRFGFGSSDGILTEKYPTKM